MFLTNFRVASREDLFRKHYTSNREVDLMQEGSVDLLLWKQKRVLHAEISSDDDIDYTIFNVVSGKALDGGIIGAPLGCCTMGSLLEFLSFPAEEDDIVFCAADFDY